MMFDLILSIIGMILAVPVGYLIAYMSNDELVAGRKWFEILIIISFIGAIGFYLWDYVSIALTFLFILIVSFISLIKSKDKIWTKRRI